MGSNAEKDCNLAKNMLTATRKALMELVIACDGQDKVNKEASRLMNETQKIEAAVEALTKQLGDADTTKIAEAAERNLGIARKALFEVVASTGGGKQGKVFEALVTDVQKAEGAVAKAAKSL